MGLFGIRAPDHERFIPSKPRAANPGLHLPEGAYIPDYKVYKLEDAPQLQETQRRLYARGLSSPWLRNDVWRYDKRIHGSEAWRRVFTLTLGWRVALPLLALTAVYEFVLKKEDDHHTGHGNHDAHGH